MHSLHSALADWSPESQAMPAMAEKLIELYEEEKLHAAVATGYMFASLAYNAIGDTKKARKYAARALETGIVNNGVSGGTDDVEEMRVMRADPKRHWSFMRRKR